MKIAVLLGGDSPEREISLRSGQAVAGALRRRKHTVVLLDPADAGFARRILNAKPECVFIALHGGKGEGGAIQGFLETVGFPHTGSDACSSAVCMNKIATKRILLCDGVPTPRFLVVEGSAEDVRVPFRFPVVVKPASLGSTIGMTVVRRRSDLAGAVRKGRRFCRDVFVEEYIRGTEVTVSVLGNRNPVVLPIIEVLTPTGYYDYRAKYTPGGSVHRIPPDLPGGTLRKIEEITLRTFRVLGCCGLARVDLMVNRKNEPLVIDVNTIPGFTATSLSPDSAKAAGIPFDELCERLVLLAVERWKREPRRWAAG